ncbi:MAG TPA: pitrilysin family protein, partial [Verrucomicrobiae bacterium]|nr:pitrilysin family protein [Verrucomicrobiae bacterium]
LIHDLFAERVWADHPLGRPILGRWDVVKDFDRDTVLGYFEREYVPTRIVVAVAGNASHEQVADLFAAGFEGWDRPAALHGLTPPAIHPGVHTVQKPLEQVHLVMGLPGVSDAAPDRHALYLLNDILGGSMSSRLFQEIRERQALVYSVHSGQQAYRDTGLFYVYAGTDPANFGKVMHALMKEIRSLKKDGVTAEELRRSKDHLKGSLMLSLESTSSRMNRLARHEMRFGSFMSMDEMLAAIDAVRMEDVDALIHRVLDEEQLSLMTLGAVSRRNFPRGLLRA